MKKIKAATPVRDEWAVFKNETTGTILRPGQLSDEEYISEYPKKTIMVRNHFFRCPSHLADTRRHLGTYDLSWRS